MEECGTHGMRILTMEIGIVIIGGTIKTDIHTILIYTDQELNG
jgi:hypothetical protein